MQVYSARPGGYSENDSVIRPVGSGSWSNFVVILPSPGSGGSLRVDVCDRPAVVEIESIALRTSSGVNLWEWRSGSPTDHLRVRGTAIQLPSDAYMVVLSYGPDPQLYLPEIPNLAPSGPVQLEIRMRIDLSGDTIRDSFEGAGLNPALARARASEMDALTAAYTRERELRQNMETSRSWRLTRPLRIAKRLSRN